MKFLNANKFFNQYLPMILTIIILVVAGLAYSLFHSQTKEAEAGWYNNSWTNRTLITIDHTKVNTATGTTTPLTNFPMVLNTTNANFKTVANSGYVGKTDGTDILFTSIDGVTKLNHELESYSSSTGAVIAWVQIPSLSSVTDTQIFIYYGNAGAADQQNIANTWDSNYKAVYHLTNGTTLFGTDSTSNGYTMSTSTASSGVGKIDGAATFNGSTQYMTTPSAPVTAFPFTFEDWVKLNSTSLGSGEWRWHGLSGSSDYEWNEYWAPGGSPEFRTVNCTSSCGSLYIARYSIPVFDTNWHHIVTVFTGPGASVMYFDGSLLTPFNSGGSASPTNLNSMSLGEIGASPGAFNGTIDESRVSNIARSADWIATEYKNQNSPSTFYILGKSIPYNNPHINFVNRGSVSMSWYNASWSNRKSIVVDHTKVNTASGTSTPLTNFPILFSVTDPELKTIANGGKVGVSDGRDILFTSGDGTTPLNYEIESYASTTGELIAWVQIPSLSSTADTPIYIYYGNAGAPAELVATKTSTWDSNFKGVYHLSNGTALNTNDSTINGNTGTGVNSPIATTGKVDGAASFSSASNQAINLGNNSSIEPTTGLTAEAWFKYTGVPGAGIFPGIVSSVNRSTTLNGFEILIHDATGAKASGIYAQLFNANSSASTLGITPAIVGSTYHVVATYDGTSLNTYINGVFNESASWGSGIGANTQNVYIGELNGYGSGYFNGFIDEVRISNIARSADWIATEYNNQNSPSTFYAYGSSSINGRQTNSGVAVPAVKIRGGVKFH